MREAAARNHIDINWRKRIHLTDMSAQHNRIAFSLHALGSSAEAWRRLPSGACAQILSTFRRGITVLPQDDPGGRPIFVSPPGEGLLPEHIIISKQDFARILAECRAGDRVTIAHRRRFYLKMPQFHASPEILCKGLEVLQTYVTPEKMTGLHMSCGEILMPDWEWGGIFTYDWNKVAPAGEENRRRILLRRLIGRGNGSTPAGDDMLVGALAFLHAWQSAPCAQTFFDTLRRMEPEFLTLTTRTSEIYLHWGLRGVFSSDIIRLATALMTGDTARIKRGSEGLLNHGDTSGLDTLTGLVLMIRGSRLAETTSHP